MKKIIMLFVCLFSLFCVSALTTNASESELFEYDVNTYFRGVWVTPKDSNNIGNIKPTASKTKEQKIEAYKAEVLRILDIMEWYNLNALIFHIRVDNDAIYYSDMNPWSDWFTVYGEDPGWDPLEWVIEETHARGIEFHAWMNPYRVKSHGVSKKTTLEEFAKNIPSYNIASDPNMLLTNTYDSNSNGIILNPGLPEVREFIIDTCMEVIEKYDVDAIHFDDYFYATGVNDDDTYAKYNPKGLNHEDWRRDQVDIFIKDLSDRMRAYNKENNRFVQLGISPSGVWKSGNGKVEYDENGTAITNGSATTTSFQHWGNYLYSDTKRWVDEEWIDYMLPQTYWAISHTSAAFKPLIDWWDAIHKYKKVNLYSGMGIYMSENPGSNYSWGKDPEEAYKQITYCYELENTVGTVFYNFTYLKDAYYGKTDSLYGQGMTKVKNELFTNPAVLPEIRTMERVSLPAVSNLNVEMGENNTVTFDALDGAKFYVIYRSNGELDYSGEQIYKIISRNSVDGKVTFVDEASKGEKYSYGVKALSGTNTLGEGSKVDCLLKVTFKDYDGSLLKEETVKYGEKATAPTPKGKDGATFVGWSTNINSITKDIEVVAKYNDSDFFVKFYDKDGNVISSQTLKYQEDAVAPNPEIEGHEFIKWSCDFTKVSQDLDVYPEYKVLEYKVTFKYTDPTTNEEVILSEETIKYGNAATAPEAVTFKGYTFEGWSEDFTSIKKDLVIEAKYEAIYFTVTFVNDEDDSVIEVQKVKYGEDAVYPEVPYVKGMNFEYWRGPINNVMSDRTVKAIYGLAEYLVEFKDWDGTVLYSTITFYEEGVVAPAVPAREGYTFVGWDTDFSEVLSDMTITALYKKDKITITYIGNDGNVLSETEVVNDKEDYPADYTAPTLEGYEFKEWEKAVDSEGNVTYTAVYTEIIVEEEPNNGCKANAIQSVFYLISALGICFILRKKRF